MITSATEVLPLECILCDLQMSNGCVGHIVWVRSGLLRYYVGTQKPGVGRYVKPHNLSRPREGIRGVPNLVTGAKELRRLPGDQRV